MSYENPILLIQQGMNAQIEDAVYKAVQKVGIYVDKDELIKALEYDREQYEKGYKDRERDIIRCKDCKYYPNGDGSTKWLPCREIITPPGWYCADGERREEEKIDHEIYYAHREKDV